MLCDKFGFLQIHLVANLYYFVGISDRFEARSFSFIPPNCRLMFVWSLGEVKLLYKFLNTHLLCRFIGEVERIQVWLLSRKGNHNKTDAAHQQTKVSPSKNYFILPIIDLTKTRILPKADFNEHR